MIRAPNDSYKICFTNNGIITYKCYHFDPSKEGCIPFWDCLSKEGHFLFWQILLYTQFKIIYIIITTLHYFSKILNSRTQKKYPSLE